MFAAVSLTSITCPGLLILDSLYLQNELLLKQRPYIARS